MATHVFRSLIVFVPIGNQTSAEDILAGVVPAVYHGKISASVVVSVFEYRNLAHVKALDDVFDETFSIIITNPDVFSCGKWYRTSEYFDLLKEEFTNCRMTIYDVNPFEVGYHRGQSVALKLPQITSNSARTVIEFVNDSIIAATKESISVDISTKHLKFMGSRLVIVGNNVVKPSTNIVPANTAVDTNVDAKILLDPTQTPSVDSSPAPTSPAVVNPVQLPPCGVPGCTACSKV